MLKLKNGGFTLVEIIISIAILSILSVGFYGVFAVVFVQTFRTGELTEAMFGVQGQMEDEILDVKTKLEHNQSNQITYSTDTIMIFDSYGSSIRRTVTGYPITLTTDTISISTFVSQTRPPQLNVPSIINGITINAKNPSIVSFPNFAHENLSVEVVNPVVDFPSYLIQHLYYWYKSPANQYTPSITPAFPDTFELIPQYNSKTIPVIDSTFAGRFVQALVTPVGEKGQVGTSVASNPILISSMPVNSNLLLHMDASFITHSSNTEMYVEQQRVKQWKDIGPTSVTLTTNSSENASPQLTQELLGEDNARRIFSIQKNTTSTAQMLTATNSMSAKANVVIYVAYRFYAVPDGGDPNLPTNATLLTTNFNSSSTNKLEIDISGGNLRFRRLGTFSPTPITFTPEEYRTGNWQIFKVVITPNSLSVATNLGLEEGVFSFSPPLVSSTASSNTTGISLSALRSLFPYGHNLGEIIVFDNSGSAHSDSDSLAMMQYLYNKYISN